MVQGEDIRVPMLFIGGWFDIYTDGVLSAFDQVRTQGRGAARAGSRLIMRPWVHRTDQERNGQLDFPKSARYGMQRAQAFIGQWLRSEPAGDSEAPNTYYLMGVEEWRPIMSRPPIGLEWP